MAQVRSIGFRIGARAWVSDDPDYHPPPGLRSRQEVILVSFQPRGWSVTVKDKAGSFYEMASHAVDYGYEYKMGSRFLPESHPEVVDCLRARLEKAQGWRRSFLGLRKDDDLDRLRFYLERNGASVPGGRSVAESMSPALGEVRHAVGL